MSTVCIVLLPYPHPLLSRPLSRVTMQNLIIRRTEARDLEKDKHQQTTYQGIEGVSNKAPHRGPRPQKYARYQKI